MSITAVRARRRVGARQWDLGSVCDAVDMLGGIVVVMVDPDGLREALERNSAGGAEPQYKRYRDIVEAMADGWRMET